MRIAFKPFIILYCLCLQLLLGWLPFSPPALAVTDSSLPDLQRKQKQIEEYRSSVNQARQKVEQQEQSVRDRLGNLQEQIGTTESEIGTQQDKLQEANDKLKTIQKELAIAQTHYGKQQTSTSARLRFLQRQGNVKGWAALLQSKSLEELMDYDEDRKALIGLKQTKDTIESKKLAVEAQKNQIALLTQQLMGQKASYEDRAQTEQILVNRLKSDQQALTAAEEQLAEESQKVSQDIQKRLAANIAFPGTIFTPGTGQMLLPSDGPVTSTFGWRVHPILGTSKFHNGVDFGAEYGTIIRAADNGVVISAGSTGGYGEAVIIDHGNDLTSLYGHASQLYVTVGQSVQKGQPIAAVGSTGFSTGPHLHFEVRRAGEPIDPMGFL
jgi:murein DD-endopeptidase MepM/ murein hydrolase activator NlpD